MTQTISIRIDDFIFILYFAALMFSIYKHRVLNSTVLCILVLLVFDYLSINVRQPLLQLSNHYFFGGNESLGIFIWYGFWAALNASLIFSLYKLHVWLNKTTTFFSKTISNTYYAFIFVQFMGYLDDKFLKSDYFHTFYTYAIPTINVTLFIFIFVWLTFIEKQRDPG